MPQVSKKKLRKKEWEKMWKQMVGLVEDRMSSEEAEVVLSGLLTETEKIMLVKRMMIWVLLNSGWSVPKICEALSISIATGYKFQEVYKLNTRFGEVMEKKIRVKQIKPKRGDRGEKLLEVLKEVIMFTYRVKYPDVFGKELTNDLNH